MFVPGGGEIVCHRAASVHATSMTYAPSGTISPLSSAIGINFAGGIVPGIDDAVPEKGVDDGEGVNESVSENAGAQKRCQMTAELGPS